VFSVLSGGIHSTYSNWEADPELSGGSYGVKNAANSAGLYNDIIWDSMSRENAKNGNNITFMHAAPGFVASRWGAEMPTVVRWIIRVSQLFGRKAVSGFGMSTKQACLSTAECLLSPV